MALRYIVVLAVVCGLGIGRIIKIDPCEVSQASICEVKEARIEPCSGSTNTAVPCILKKGHNASISFDFIPHFSATNLKTDVNYQGHPYEGFGSSEACLFTKCPTEAGVIQTMDYALKIGRFLPKGVFTFEWKVWNVDNSSDVCCFQPTIRLK